ncbi:DUF6037 family protein [Erysipelothrix aquatica]|uniref:DUF6037 family protein n=1 Tax=Erysipelothrix aquatica TaxID=2683714 RepID=UPI001358E760|nr:DUF6037 family protein [Erysipelothrix aquatica]
MEEYTNLTNSGMRNLMPLRDSMREKYIPITSFDLFFDDENYNVVVRIATDEEQADCRSAGFHYPLVRLKFIRESDGACFECFANRSEFVDKNINRIVGFFWLSDKWDPNIKSFSNYFTNQLFNEIGRACPKLAVDYSGKERQFLVNQMNELFLEDKRNKYLYGLKPDSEYSYMGLRHNEEKAYLLYPEFYRATSELSRYSIPLNAHKGYVYLFGDDSRLEVKSFESIKQDYQRIFE